MHTSSVALTLFAFSLFQSAAGQHYNTRRHHKRTSKCKANTTQSASTKNASSSSTSSSDPFASSEYLSINGIRVGFLPDNGDSGGTQQDINELNTYIGQKSFSVGLYAHIFEDIPFDGAELTDLGASQLSGNSGLNPGTVSKSSVDYKKGALFKQVKKSGSVFIASVMPVGSWSGLTADNNTQAVRVAKVLKKFTDAGIETWLRYAHEANWYNSDSCTEGPSKGKVYAGTNEDVKASWAVMAAARDKYAPKVKMYWSPNTGSQSEIQSYAPDNLSTIDVVGVDWYPSDSTQDLASSFQWMHDTYASEKVPFTIGETGMTTAISERQTLLKTWTSAATAQKMPYFKVINWFNYNKGADFMLGGDGCSDCAQSQVQEFFSGLADSK